jgi:predicted dienelactone hydrolase
MPARLALPGWLRRYARLLQLLLLLGLLLIIAGIAYVEVRRHQPLTLPAPTGPYAVGRVEYAWTDQARTDPLAPHAGTKRALVVWAWYPAAGVPSAQPAPYLPPPWATVSDQQRGLIGQQLFQSADSIRTNSIAQAPLAPGAARYPVLIFEPGYGLIPTQYTTLLEDLASHGYIVFAIAPTYSADAVVFPDGRVVERSPAGSLPESGVGVQAAGDRLVMVWARDVIFIMNQLQRLNAARGQLFSGRLDLARLGVFGHSFGGATAAQVCHMDTRCKAGVDLDGDLAGSVVHSGLTTPFMVLQSDCGGCADAPCRAMQGQVQAILRTVPHGARYDLSIAGLEHFNFADYAVEFTPLRLLGVLGSIDGVRGLQITRAYVRAFFDTYLTKGPSPLLQGSSRAYPEVHVIPLAP